MWCYVQFLDCIHQLGSPDIEISTFGLAKCELRSDIPKTCHTMYLLQKFTDHIKVYQFYCIAVLLLEQDSIYLPMFRAEFITTVEYMSRSCSPSVSQSR